MRIPRFRWTLRSLMLAIALLGPIFVGGEALHDLAGRGFRDRARWHEARATLFRNMAIQEEYRARVLDPSLGPVRAVLGNVPPYDPRFPPGSPAAPYLAGESLRYATWHAALVAHHERAAAWYRRSAEQPWLQVPMIPAEPKIPGPGPMPPIAWAAITDAEASSSPPNP